MKQWLLVGLLVLGCEIRSADQRARLERLSGEQVYLKRVTIFGIERLGGWLSQEEGHWVLLNFYPNEHLLSTERLSRLDCRLIRKATLKQVIANQHRLARQQVHFPLP